MAYGPQYGYAQIGGRKFTLTSEDGPASLNILSVEKVNELCKEIYKKRREEDRKYFFSRFSFFWENRAQIAAHCEIGDIHPLFAGLSLAYIGGGPLSLGALMALWDSGAWNAPCPECGSTARIYFAGGSPLSGSHGFNAQCPDCGAQILDGRAESFIKLWQPAKKLIPPPPPLNLPDQPAKPPRPREDFRTISCRWRKEYDEKSDEELAQIARERKRKQEQERRQELVKAIERYKRLNLTPDALPTEVAAAMLEKLHNTMIQ